MPKASEPYKGVRKKYIPGKMKKIFAAVLMVAVLGTLCACGAGGGQAAQNVDTNAAHVQITFNFQRQSGYATNQFAVWVEDMQGNIVKTLYATSFTANGGYEKRPDALPLWVEKAGLASMQGSEVDAITGATPKTGDLTFLWDLKDEAGQVVAPGEYGFFVEGSLRWKNRVLYSGTIEVGDAPDTAQASAEFFYEASDEQEALTDEAPECNMIGAVAASFVPAAGA